MPLAPGQEAPDLSLKDQHGADVRLSELRGEHVVLVFYPFTFTGVCEGELCSLRDDPGLFSASGARVIAISCDSRHSQRVWAEQRGFQFPLLSDFWPHGEVARSYGVFDEKLGCATRTTFVINREGIIADVFSSPDLATARERAAYEAALSRLD